MDGKLCIPAQPLPQRAWNHGGGLSCFASLRAASNTRLEDWCVCRGDLQHDF
jgi:hypothetical protein